MDDGVELGATLYTPDGPAPAGGWPAVLFAHGLGDSRADEDNALAVSPNRIAETHLAPRGYAVLTWDTRGQGDSGGLTSVVGTREVADTRALFDYLGSRPGVNRAKIGGIGYSLGGGLMLRAAVDGVPFAALQIGTFWTDLYRAFVTAGVLKTGIVTGFLSSLMAERATAEVNALRAGVFMTPLDPAFAPFSRERSTSTRLRGLRTPTLLFQGRRDFAFDLTEAIDAYGKLAGPKRLYFTTLGHAPATKRTAEIPHLFDEGRLWFDRYLKGVPNGIDKRPPVEIATDPFRKTVEFRALPPTRTLQLTFAGSQTLTSLGKIVHTVRLPRGAQETFGKPSVKVALSRNAGFDHLVAVLAATRAGVETIVSVGGATTASVGAKTRTVTIPMASQVTSIPAGSTVRLFLVPSSLLHASNDPYYLQGAAPRSTILVGKASLSLPLLRTPISR
jgi:predicted acyl esterase